MKALKFTLKGEHAFFKVPEVNTYYYFTYGNIHKVALLGIFGAVLGYKGYGYMESGRDYPEFYERLKDIQISIVPSADKGYYHKKIQTFNNSVGYASFEQGGNLIIKEQWLEHPAWDIYVLINNEESEVLAEAITKNRCVYMPYLGKNDHPADILNPRLMDVQTAECLNVRSHSLFPAESAEYDMDDGEGTFKYEELLPYELDKATNLYKLKRFIYTDAKLEQVGRPLYRAEEKYLFFY